ncbi:Small integral membrane protein 4 [Orchesella cincta]|uniref:Small integral membrane protein 4 n=1 Tax=Orchesella cincta TaxID=48709 RepID=A0A1D2N264_ORCCI|nr:Small integral membrane protein 4 [Orchesella cincta]
MRSQFVKRVLDSIPGKKTFGLYRFLPAFFILGAALEFSMINWKVNNQVNFYNTYKKRRAEEIAKIIHNAQNQSISSSH